MVWGEQNPREIWGQSGTCLGRGEFGANWNLYKAKKYDENEENTQKDIWYYRVEINLVGWALPKWYQQVVTEYTKIHLHNGKSCSSVTKESYFDFHQSLETPPPAVKPPREGASCEVVCSSQLHRQTRVSRGEVKRKTGRWGRDLPTWTTASSPVKWASYFHHRMFSVRIKLSGQSKVISHGRPWVPPPSPSPKPSKHLPGV